MLDSKGGRIENWWRWGLRHREDGPALIAYTRDGKLVRQRWMLWGSEPYASEDEFERATAAGDLDSEYGRAADAVYSVYFRLASYEEERLDVLGRAVETSREKFGPALASASGLVHRPPVEQTFARLRKEFARRLWPGRAADEAVLAGLDGVLLARLSFDELDPPLSRRSRSLGSPGAPDHGTSVQRHEYRR